MSVKPMRRASPPEGIVGLEELPAVKMRMAPAHDTTMITRVVVAHLFGGTGIQGIIRHMTLLRMIIQAPSLQR